MSKCILRDQSRRFAWAAACLIAVPIATGSATASDDIFSTLPADFKPTVHSPGSIEIDARTTSDAEIGPARAPVATQTTSPIKSDADDDPSTQDRDLFGAGFNEGAGVAEEASREAQVPQRDPVLSVRPVASPKSADANVIRENSSADQEQSASVSAPETKKVANTADQAFDDIPIFDRRARAKLEAEGTVKIVPHPLAVQHPDHFTVVCEAGCEVDDVSIVYQELQAARGPVNEPGDEMQELPVEAAKNIVLCVGGCYHGERVAPSLAELAGDRFAPIVDADNSWMSNEAPEPTQQPQEVRRLNSPNTDGRWFDRIGE
ncbi:MAG: hypothetical protein AAGG72_00575 [Pseudomonadota bacterium]